MTTIRPNSGMVSQNENRKKEIQLQLRQAMATLRMLPLDARDRPKQASSAWGGSANSNDIGRGIAAAD